MLEAFQNRHDRSRVDEVMTRTYGPRKAQKINRKNQIF